MLLTVASSARRRPARLAVPFDAIWQYLPTNAIFDASAPSYDDSAWAKGEFPFGTGVFPEPLEYGLNNVPNTSIPELTGCWFRKHYNMIGVPNRDGTASVFQYNYLDFYVNGHLIYSNRSDGSAFRVFFHTITIPKDVLVTGDNVIAIFGNGYDPSVGNKSYLNCSFSLA